MTSTYQPPAQITQADINAFLGKNSNVKLQKLFDFSPTLSGGASVNTGNIHAAPIVNTNTVYTPPSIVTQADIDNAVASG